METLEACLMEELPRAMALYRIAKALKSLGHYPGEGSCRLDYREKGGPNGVHE